jgi:hypothetical protein
MDTFLNKVNTMSGIPFFHKQGRAENKLWVLQLRGF